MAKSILSVIVALSIFATPIVNSAIANDRLPFVKEGEVPTPTVLADRIEESLKKDPSGGGLVKGANAGPSLFLEGVKYKRPHVDTYPELVAYLRSLTPGPMPGGQIRLSEIDMVKGKPVIDLAVGTTRWAKKDESGWYDKEGFVLAGNCMQMQLPLRITVYDPMVGEKFVDPYAGKPREVKTTSCPLGDRGRYVAGHMFEPKVAQDECAAAYMLPQDGKIEDIDAMANAIYRYNLDHPEAIKGSQSIEDIKKDLQKEVWSRTYTFSRQCGKVIHEGGSKFSTKAHAVEIAVVKGKEKHVFFTGSLKGKTFTADAESEALIAKNGEAVLVPKAFDDGVVLATFTDQAKVRTPAPSGVGENIANLKEGCAVTVLTAIEMP